MCSTDRPICSLVPRPYPSLCCTTQVTWLMAFCWLDTTKKLLNGHQTPFLVRGWGLATRLYQSCHKDTSSVSYMYSACNNNCSIRNLCRVLDSDLHSDYKLLLYEHGESVPDTSHNCNSEETGWSRKKVGSPCLLWIKVNLWHTTTTICYNSLPQAGKFWART